MTEPTDAEIRGLAATGNGVYQDDETAIWEIADPSLMKLVHDALAKWGQPAQAADSAGRDADRIEKWSDRIQRAHPKSEPEFWPDALRVKYMADEISDLRAARAALAKWGTPPAVAPWRSAVLDLIDECPGLTMGQDQWLSRRVKELDFASAPQPTQAQAENCAVCGHGNARLVVMRSCDVCGSDYEGLSESEVNAVLEQARKSTQPQSGAVPLTDEYPALVCNYCGALTPDPWHSSGMLHGKMSKHIHSCDACAARGAQDTREPLTPEQIQDLLLCGNPTDEEMRLIRIGWDAAIDAAIKRGATK